MEKAHVEKLDCKEAKKKDVTVEKRYRIRQDVAFFVSDGGRCYVCMLMEMKKSH